MIYLAYYDGDPVGRNAAGCLKRYGDVIGDDKEFRIVELGEPPIYAKEDELRGADSVMFISKHASAKGVTSFTVHSCGNWGTSADLGGMPKTLCKSDPIAMWKLLVSIRMENSYDDVAVTYEATHHGPLIGIPCLFIEVGGNDEALVDERYAEVLAKAIHRYILDRNRQHPKIAIGIGGSHYPSKFTDMALEGKRAFSYIMSRYNTDNTDMLGKAAGMSTLKPEVAVIEWKSLNAEDRKNVIEALDAIGLGYERI